MLPLLLQVDNSVSFYNNNIVLILGGLMLLSIGTWLYFLKKKHPDLDIGPLIATAMTDKHETIFMSLIFLEYVATSIIAATVHGPHSTGLEMSPLGRVLAHISLSVTGTVCQFVLATDIAIIFVKNQPIGNRIGNFLTMLMVGFLAMYIPYLNLTLIASATGESLAFETWWYSISPFTTEAELQAFFIKVGYPPSYQPWGNLSTIMHVCIATAGVIHYGLTPIEGLRTISSTKRRGLLMQRVYKDLGIEEEKKDKDKDKDGKNVNEKINDRDKAEKVKQIIPNAEFLLNRIGYSSDPKKRGNIAKEIQKVIIGSGSGEPDKDSMTLTYRLGALVNRAKTIDANKPADKADQNKALEKDIREFFSGKSKDATGNLIAADKRGLGISIKN